jgi:hypothetical protein
MSCRAEGSFGITGYNGLDSVRSFGTSDYNG